MRSVGIAYAAFVKSLAAKVGRLWLNLHCTRHPASIGAFIQYTGYWIKDLQKRIDWSRDVDSNAPD